MTLETLHILIPMAVHILWCVILYAALTVLRAPLVWGYKSNTKIAAVFKQLEPRACANLANQFEWPIFFHLACLIAIVIKIESSVMFTVLVWVFIVGRVIHSVVHVFTKNVRLRGSVFSINFLAVLGLWFCLVENYWS